MAQILVPAMKGALQGTSFRKFVVYCHRQDADSSVSSESLAKQMTHSRATADSHYYVDPTFPEQSQVADFIERITTDSAASTKTKYHRPPTCTISKAPVDPTPETIRVPWSKAASATCSSCSERSVTTTDPSRQHTTSSSSADESTLSTPAPHPTLPPSPPTLVPPALDRPSTAPKPLPPPPVTAPKPPPPPPVTAPKPPTPPPPPPTVAKPPVDLEDNVPLPLRKSVLKLFMPYLLQGVCPDLATVSSSLQEEESLKHLQPNIVKEYVRQRAIKPKTSAEERPVRRASPQPIVHPGSSRLFSVAQTTALRDATSNLNSNAFMAEIVHALSRSKTCRELGMFPKSTGGSFTRQQLRDKFKSLRKSLDKKGN